MCLNHPWFSPKKGEAKNNIKQRKKVVDQVFKPDLLLLLLLLLLRLLLLLLLLLLGQVLLNDLPRFTQ